MSFKLFHVDFYTQVSLHFQELVNFQIAWEYNMRKEDGDAQTRLHKNENAVWILLHFDDSVMKIHNLME